MASSGDTADTPTFLNAVARIVLMGKDCIPDRLNDLERAERVFGSGAWAERERDILDMAQRLIEAEPYRFPSFARGSR